MKKLVTNHRFAKRNAYLIVLTRVHTEYKKSALPMSTTLGPIHYPGYAELSTAISADSIPDTSYEWEQFLLQWLRKSDSRYSNAFQVRIDEENIATICLESGEEELDLLVIPLFDHNLR